MTHPPTKPMTHPTTNDFVGTLLTANEPRNYYVRASIRWLRDTGNVEEADSCNSEAARIFYSNASSSHQGRRARSSGTFLGPVRRGWVASHATERRRLHGIEKTSEEALVLGVFTSESTPSVSAPPAIGSVISSLCP